MGDEMTDWADDVVSNFRREYFLASSVYQEHALAAALRKAKADGMREAATFTLGHKDAQCAVHWNWCLTVGSVIADELKSLATQTEKGE